MGVRIKASRVSLFWRIFRMIARRRILFCLRKRKVRERQNQAESELIAMPAKESHIETAEILSHRRENGQHDFAFTEAGGSFAAIHCSFKIRLRSGKVRGRVRT